MNWQRGNFNVLVVNVVEDASVPNLIVVPIAQIQDHVADGTVATGRALSEQVRFMEVGGVVFDWQSNIVDVTQDDDEGIWIVQQQLLLVSDRLDEVGNPVALNTDWFSSTTPTTLAQSQAENDEDTTFPTKVHWRHSRNLAGGKLPTLGVATSVSPAQVTIHAQGSANLRLRLRLDDEHALAFHLTTDIANTGGVLTGAAVSTSVCGSIYYRTKF